MKWFAIILAVLIFTACKTPATSSKSTALDVATTTASGDKDRNEETKHIEITARNRSVVVFIYAQDSTVSKLVQNLDSVILQTIKTFENDRQDKKQRRKQ